MATRVEAAADVAREELGTLYRRELLRDRIEELRVEIPALEGRLQEATEAAESARAAWGALKAEQREAAAECVRHEYGTQKRREADEAAFLVNRKVEREGVPPGSAENRARELAVKLDQAHRELDFRQAELAGLPATPYWQRIVAGGEL